MNPLISTEVPASGLTHPAPPTPMAGEAVQAFAGRLRGTLLRPDDDGYEAARSVWNARFRRAPALIARCAGPADVVRAVEFARSSRLPVSVRGGGHDFAGRGVCDDGLVIDLSRMKGVRVDPTRRTVAAQAGLTWGELDHETQAFGLATTGGKVPSTGIAGLTLGGGYGWLMRKHGLAIDNLLAADVVLADGRLVRAAADENPDLFWALRGGGGNFGVVTALELRLHPVGPTVLGGVALYPLSAADQVLRFFREFIGSAPDELMALVAFRVPPPARFVPPDLRGMPALMVMLCYAGPIEDGLRAVAPLRAFGPPVADRVGPMPYTAVQRMLEAAGAPGFHVSMASDHLAGLGDDAIARLVDFAGRLPSPDSVLVVLPLGGAVARVAQHETAYGHRGAGFDYSAYALWTDPAEEKSHLAWTEELAATMRPLSVGVYVNQLAEEGEGRIRAAYSPEGYARLAALKAVFDPGNLFRHNNNIRPAADRARK